LKSNLELAIKHYQENPKEGVRNVSKKFHISYEKLLNSLKEKGVEIIQPKRLDFLEKYVDAKLDYLNGDSLSKISKRRNISKTSLRSELLKDGIIKNIKPCKSIYRLRYNTIDAYKVYNIIYNNQTIYLERKFNHALPFL